MMPFGMRIDDAFLRTLEPKASSVDGKQLQQNDKKSRKHGKPEQF